MACSDFYSLRSSHLQLLHDEGGHSADLIELELHLFVKMRRLILRLHDLFSDLLVHRADQAELLLDVDTHV